MHVSHPDRPLSAAARAACAAWFGPGPLEVGPSPGRGFSGAPLALVRPRGMTDWFVLKAFAAGTPRERAEWVHGLAVHLASAGVALLPRPLATPDGRTTVVDDRGVIWELVPRIDGTATDAPSPSQAAAALTALARLHVAAATLPGAAPRPAPPAGAMRRIARARELLERPWRTRRPPRGPGDDAFAARLERAIAIFDAAAGDRAVAVVAAARVDDVPVQAVLRDVWSAHVLFAAADASRVAGIVDPHAAGIDTPATDLARLLGSWRRGPGAAADPVGAWPEAVAAYGAVRHLSPRERELVAFLHAAGVVCGLDNWFRWTLDADRPGVAVHGATERIDRLLQDLPGTLEWLANRGPFRV